MGVNDKCLDINSTAVAESDERTDKENKTDVYLETSFPIGRVLDEIDV